MGDNVLDELLAFGDEEVEFELQPVRLIECIVAAEEELRNLPNLGDLPIDKYGRLIPPAFDREKPILPN